MIEGLWELANDVETVSYKLNSIKAVVELLAEKLISEPESGVAWAIAEMLEVHEAKLEDISNNLMVINRNAKETQDEKKGKKK